VKKVPEVGREYIYTPENLLCKVEEILETNGEVEDRLVRVSFDAYESHMLYGPFGVKIGNLEELGPEEVVIGEVTGFDDESQTYHFETIGDNIMDVPASLLGGSRLMLGPEEARWFEIYLRRNSSCEVVKWEKAVSREPIKPLTEEELKELFGGGNEA